MKLYYTPGACSLSPHIVMREAGLPVELKKVDLATKKVDDGSDYNQVNPKGYVPALVLDDGQVLTEGPAIVQYLADKNPSAGLAAANGSMARYRQQEWLGFISTEIHKAFAALFNPAATAEGKAAAIAMISRRLTWLDGQIKSAGYLAGEQFSIADAYLFTVLGWTGYVGIDLKQWPNLAAYHARVAARPKVQEALKAEGLMK
jgi:glutathione S-transferase